MFHGLGNATLYFRTADEAVAQRDELGTAASASRARWSPAACASAPATRRLPHREQGRRSSTSSTEGDPPELFQPGIPVVLEGRFATAAHFASDRILVKHSETYVAENPERVTTTRSPAP